MLNIWYAHDLPYGPRPIWARAHMSQGPYGPGPLWARAHMGQGPYGPEPKWMGQGPYGPGPIWAPGPWAAGPSLLGKHLTQKRTLEKRVQIVFFCVFFGNKKDARRPYDHFGGGIAPRSLLCARKRRFPFCEQMSKFCVRFAKNDHREPCVTVCPSEK